MKNIVVIEDDESEARRLMNVLMEKYNPESLLLFESCKQASADAFAVPPGDYRP